MSGVWFKARVVDVIPGLKTFQPNQLVWVAKVTDDEWWATHEFGAAVLSGKEAATALKSFQPRQFNDALGRGMWAQNRPASRKQLNYMVSLMHKLPDDFRGEFFEMYGFDEDPANFHAVDFRWVSSQIASGVIEHALRCQNLSTKS